MLPRKESQGISLSLQIHKYEVRFNISQFRANLLAKINISFVLHFELQSLNQIPEHGSEISKFDGENHSL